MTQRAAWPIGRSRRRRAARLAGLLVLVAGTLTCSPAYVIRAGIEEGRILSRRRPIAEVVADPGTTAAERAKLRLVLEARTFADRVLGLDVGDSYTTYSWVESDTLLLVVSAAYRDRFQPHTWWFPIVGRVPYKGFFDFAAAQREAARLEARGFDTYVRPSPAFSTLGFFNDPVLNTVLRAGDVGLVSTVIHELLHNTLFLAGQVAFNESFASFVGDRGAIAFFCARDGDDSATCRAAHDEWADNLAFGAFITTLVDGLESLYARTDLDPAQKIAARDTVFDAARMRFRSDVEPRLRTRAFRGFDRRELNNATLIGIRLYYRHLDRFDEAFRRSGGELVTAIRGIHDAARGSAEPFAALERWIRSLPEGPPPGRGPEGTH